MYDRQHLGPVCNCLLHPFITQGGRPIRGLHLADGETEAEGDCMACPKTSRKASGRGGVEPWPNDRGSVASLIPAAAAATSWSASAGPPPTLPALGSRQVNPTVGRVWTDGATSNLLEEVGCTNPKILSVQGWEGAHLCPSSSTPQVRDSVSALHGVS